MGNELHIRLHDDVIESPDEILKDFPFEEGQSLISYQSGMLVIDMAGADDTTYLQEWYLNGHDSIFSFFVVEDE